MMAPSYADAYAELADVYFQRATFGWSEFAQQDVETAIRLAQKALEIDEECVLAHSVLARAYTAQQKYDLGLAESERALQINPSDAEVLLARAAVLLWTGRIDESIAAARAGIAPQRQYRSRGRRSISASPTCSSRRYADAVQAARGGAHALSGLSAARFSAGRLPTPSWAAPPTRGGRSSRAGARTRTSTSPASARASRIRRCSAGSRKACARPASTE